MGLRTLNDLFVINRKVMAAFEERERRVWTVETVVIELAKQVGDLARTVMAREQYYLADRDQQPAYDGANAQIGNELADVLYCVMRLADHYGVELEGAYLAARTDEWRTLRDEPAPW